MVLLICTSQWSTVDASRLVTIHLCSYTIVMHPRGIKDWVYKDTIRIIHQPCNVDTTWTWQSGVVRTTHEHLRALYEVQYMSKPLAYITRMNGLIKLDSFGVTRESATWYIRREQILLIWMDKELTNCMLHSIICHMWWVWFKNLIEMNPNASSKP